MRIGAGRDKQKTGASRLGPLRVWRSLGVQRRAGGLLDRRRIASPQRGSPGARQRRRQRVQPKGAQAQRTEQHPARVHGLRGQVLQAAGPRQRRGPEPHTGLLLLRGPARTALGEVALLHDVEQHPCLLQRPCEQRKVLLLEVHLSGVEVELRLGLGCGAGATVHRQELLDVLRAEGHPPVVPGCAARAQGLGHQLVVELAHVGQLGVPLAPLAQELLHAVPQVLALGPAAVADGVGHLDAHDLHPSVRQEPEAPDQAALVVLGQLHLLQLAGELWGLQLELLADVGETGLDHLQR
mmetsp:Transcript_52981/g.138076  ORF Transcript_52981/g.138076 Transcript_52981/m.138076 type:complete len:296 (-) Transcript_52981:952-1839(-)